MLTYYENQSFDCSAAVMREDAGPLSRPVTFDLLTFAPKINPTLWFLNVIVVCSEFGGLRFNDFSTYHMKTHTVTYLHHIQSDTCSWLVMLCISALYAVGRDMIYSTHFKIVKFKMNGTKDHILDTRMLSTVESSSETFLIAC